MVEKKNFEQVDVKVVPAENDDIICTSDNAIVDGGRPIGE